MVRSTGRKTCPNATLYIKNLTCHDLVSNPGLRGGSLTNRLSHDTAHSTDKKQSTVHSETEVASHRERSALALERHFGDSCETKQSVRNTSVQIHHVDKMQSSH